MRSLLLLLPVFAAAAPPGEVRLILPQASPTEPAVIAAARRALLEDADAATAIGAIADAGQRRLWLSIAHVFAGEPLPAIRLLRAAPAAALAEDAQHRLVLGYAYSQAGQWLLFRSSMERAAHLAPRDDIPHYLLGRYWDAQIEDLERAQQAFEQALGRNPNRALTRYHLGSVLERRGNLKSAEAHYTALQEYPLALLGRARLQQAAGAPTEALALALRAERAAPGHPDILRLVAKLLHSDPVAALPHWRKLTETAPNEASHWYGLMRTLLALGQHQEAATVRKQFELVRQVYGNH